MLAVLITLVPVQNIASLGDDVKGVVTWHDF